MVPEWPEMRKSANMQRIESPVLNFALIYIPQPYGIIRTKVYLPYRDYQNTRLSLLMLVLTQRTSISEFNQSDRGKSPCIVATIYSRKIQAQMEELLNILSVCHMRNSKFDHFLVDLLIKVDTFKTKYEDVNNQLSFQYETH